MLLTKSVLWFTSHSDQGEARGPRKKKVKVSTRVAELDRQIRLENNNLQQLKDGTHPEYLRRLKKLEEEYHERLRLNQEWKERQMELTEELWHNDQRAAFDELVEKMEAIAGEKQGTCTFPRGVLLFKKSPSNRKNNTDQEVSVSLLEEPKIKCSLNLLLDQKAIEEDLTAIATGTIPPSLEKNSESTVISASSNELHIHAQDPSTLQTPFEVKIEHRKLLYAKQWFLRGQSVFVWGKDLSKFPAIISSIGIETISFKSIIDEAVVKICITQLLQGEITIKRRIV